MKPLFLCFLVLFASGLHAAPHIDPVIGTLTKGPIQSKDKVSAVYLIQSDEVLVEEVPAQVLGVEWTKPPFQTKLQNLFFSLDTASNSLRFALDLSKTQQRVIFFRAKNKIAPYQEFIESFYTLYTFFYNSKAYAKNSLDRFPGKVGPLIK